VDHLTHKIQGQGVSSFRTVQGEEPDAVFNLELDILISFMAAPSSGEKIRFVEKLTVFSSERVTPALPFAVIALFPLGVEWNRVGLGLEFGPLLDLAPRRLFSPHHPTNSSGGSLGQPFVSFYLFP